MSASGERAPGSGAIPRWRARVLSRGGRALAEGAEDTWSWVSVRRFGTGTGEVLVVGYRYAGTGDVLDYDIVERRDDRPAVAVHRGGLQRGSVRFDASSIVEYAADYPAGEPACCPPRYRRSVLARDDGVWRIVSEQFVDPDAVEASQL